MEPDRVVVVNADDLGQTPGINDGIMACHREGIVTSASLMVRWPAAEDAVRRAAAQPDLSVGLHIDLGEWEWLGAWTSVYSVVAPEDADAVRNEILQQLERFHRMVGRDPTHLDSHQHVHRKEPTRSIVLEIGSRLGVPVRHEAPRIRHCGDFYGQSETGTSLPERVSTEALVRLVESAPPGITELLCHPALRADMRGMYREERVAEVSALRDPRVVEAAARRQVRLCSFTEIATPGADAGRETEGEAQDTRSTAGGPRR